MPKFPQTSFTAGELTPLLHARVDLSRYVAGAAKLLNMTVHAHGGVCNRPGTEYINEVKYSAKATRLIPFSFNAQDTYALEFGDQYMRVYRNGGLVVLGSTPPAWVTSTAYGVTNHVSNGGTNYYCYVAHTSSATDEPGVGANWQDYWYALTSDIVEIPTPYLEAELFEINFTQSNDIITLVHPNHLPRELARTAHTAWDLRTIAFEPLITAPTNCAAARGGGLATGSVTRTFVVTAVDEVTGEESLPSNEGSVATEADSGWTEGEYIAVTWDAVTGASKYNVYKEKNGVFGYIGSTPDTTFNDDKILPELSDTPPNARDPFDAAGLYPSVVGYHQQRLVFGASDTYPQKMWFSQTGNFHNFGVSEPLKDDDAITITLASGQVNVIRGMASMSDLIVLTAGAEHKIASGDNAFTLDNIQVKPQSFRGASALSPLLMGENLLYVQDKGQVVRDFGYALEIDGYRGNDLSVLSEHLFRRHTLVSWAYAQTPGSIVWCVRDDGKLLGMTYMKEHEVWGWTQHETDGSFESVISISEGDIDAVYFIVNRTINGGTKRYVERLKDRYVTDVKDAFFVDCGATYDGAATDTVSGLSWLEGEEVAVLADGNVHPRVTVTSGAITLDYEASKIHIGLPYTSTLITLEPPLERAPHGAYKSVSRLIVEVLNSRGMWAGPFGGELYELKQRTNEAWGDPIALFSGVFEIELEGNWGTGKLQIEQRDPLPITISSIIPEYDIGD